MNTLHYPDIERCKKLTEIGFPFGDLHYFNDKIETTDGLHEWAENHLGVYDKSFRCPSVMEMLDVIPNDLGTGKLNDVLKIQNSFNDWSVSMGKSFHTEGTLPNAVSDLILWLVENGYLKF